MFLTKKTAIYLSSDESDYNLAKEILEKEHIKYYEFASEEMPVVGCGARINPARVNNHLDLMIFRLSVAPEDVEKAITVLQGNVRFVLTGALK
ncbi:hypothetical protein [Succinivibrio dextrinosolvens]|uniref:hypothetical protein n=1 Tax=Succinivibrio dextrinosolvens TaxID=83771 RepID=UPI0004E1B538|nr:hypothetical protein [Succinivibrio dextrinosolvens]